MTLSNQSLYSFLAPGCWFLLNVVKDLLVPGCYLLSKRITTKWGSYLSLIAYQLSSLQNPLQFLTSRMKRGRRLFWHSNRADFFDQFLAH